MNVVLDTNVWLDWLVFDDPSTRSLHTAALSGGLVLLASAATRAEWLDVIERSVFGLERQARDAVVAVYERHAILRELPPALGSAGSGRAGPALVCRDPDDQKFLELAVASEAPFLVTRDRALLDLARLARRSYRLSIVRPDSPEWQAALAERRAGSWSAENDRAHL
jgi:predicted nucleic acid-binding protein